MDKIPLPEYEAVPMDRIAEGLTGLRILFVNVFALSSGSGWTLIDAGIPHSSGRIKRWAEKEFGEGARPEQIILTHGHFDHVGAIGDLLKEWDVPVYAHVGEMPYLTGRSHYPPPNPGAGGGLMAVMSPLYPRGPIDISSHVRELPADGTDSGAAGMEVAAYARAYSRACFVLPREGPRARWWAMRSVRQRRNRCLPWERSNRQNYTVLRLITHLTGGWRWLQCGNSPGCGQLLWLRGMGVLCQESMFRRRWTGWLRILRALRFRRTEARRKKGKWSSKMGQALRPVPFSFCAG